MRSLNLIYHSYTVDPMCVELAGLDINIKHLVEGSRLAPQGWPVESKIQ